MQFKAYGKKIGTPSRKNRKGLRNSVFTYNKKTAKAERKARRLERKSQRLEQGE